MKLFPHLRIAQKVPLAIVGGALVVSAAVGIVSYVVASSTMESMAQDRLRAISLERAEKVTAFLDGLAEDVVRRVTTGASPDLGLADSDRLQDLIKRSLRSLSTREAVAKEA